jgi:amphi-Trp domain-containing protein
LDERETGMRREEIADWLEEMAGQLRHGTLMVDGDTLMIPEKPGVRVKSRKKDGARRLRLELAWPEKSTASKGKSAKKAKKKQSPRVNNGASAQNAETPEMVPGTGDRAECNGHSQNDCDSSDNERGAGNRPTVRDHDSHVLVCKGGDCSKKGGKETRKAFKSELRAEGMNADVRMDSVECLGLCKQGPNVIVYPEGSWYLGLKESDVPEIVAEHLKNGEPVERLTAERRPRKKKAKK